MCALSGEAVDGALESRPEGKKAWENCCGKESRK